MTKFRWSLVIANRQSEPCASFPSPYPPLFISALFFIWLYLSSPGGIPEMKYNRVEDLPVWNDAITLAVSVFALTARADLRVYSSLRNQIERAAVFVSNNIAEGFERGTTQELLTLLYISRGSSGETRSMLCLLERLPGLGNLRSEISDLKSKAVSVSRQLRAWADSLQNSDIRGQRYLTNKTKRSTNQACERKDFLEQLRKMQEEHRPSSERDGPS